MLVYSIVLGMSLVLCGTSAWEEEISVLEGISQMLDVSLDWFLVAVVLCLLAFLGAFLGGRGGAKSVANRLARDLRRREESSRNLGAGIETALPTQTSESVPIGGGGVRSENPDAEEIRQFLVDAFGDSVGTKAGLQAYMQNIAEQMDALEADMNRCVDDAKQAREPMQSPETGAPRGNWLLGALSKGGQTLQRAHRELSGDVEYSVFSREVGMETVLKGVNELRRLVSQGERGGAGSAQAVLNEPWFNRLIRAEALCHAYYPTEAGWGALRQGLGLCGVVLREFMLQSGIDVPRVRLLTPLRGSESEAVSGEGQRLKGLPMPSSIVRALGGGAIGGAPLVLDCIRAGYRSADGTHRVRAAVVAYNPADWR